MLMELSTNPEIELPVKLQNGFTQEKECVLLFSYGKFYDRSKFFPFIMAKLGLFEFSNILKAL